MILVDTHVVLWLALEPGKISRPAKAAMERARKDGEGLAIAGIALFELAMLARKGRIRLNISLESFLTEIEARFEILPMTGRVCAMAVTLPAAYPKDPADRIIAATALVHGIPLVSADEGIRRSNVVQTIW